MNTTGTIYRFNAGAWNQLSSTERGDDGEGYIYAQANTPGFSSFLLSGSQGPTAVSLLTFKLQPYARHLPLHAWVLFSTLAALTALLWHHWRKERKNWPVSTNNTPSRRAKQKAVQI